MTTRDQIGAWFDQGVEQGAAYMAVWCDTYDWSDYPSYYASAEECQRGIDKADQNTQKVMEVYNLRGSRNKQLSLTRCWALRPIR